MTPEIQYGWVREATARGDIEAFVRHASDLPEHLLNAACEAVALAWPDDVADFASTAVRFGWEYVGKCTIWWISDQPTGAREALRDGRWAVSYLSLRLAHDDEHARSQIITILDQFGYPIPGRDSAGWDGLCDENPVAAVNALLSENYRLKNVIGAYLLRQKAQREINALMKS